MSRPDDQLPSSGSFDSEDGSLDDEPVLSETASFEEALATIEDAETLDVSVLSGLADLDRRQVKAFAEVWSALPQESRVTIAQQLEILADANVLLDFSRVFRRLLGDETSAVRQFAAAGLANYDHLDFLDDLLAAAADDPSVDVRVEAVNALESFTTAIDMDLLPPQDVRHVRQVLNAILDDGKAAPDIRAAALSTAAADPDMPGIDDRARQYLASGDADLRIGAIRAIGRTGESGWMSTLESALRGSDADERQAAAWALGAMQNPAAVPWLTMAAREDGEHPVRMEAIVALGSIGGRQAANALSTLREHASDDDLDTIDEALMESTEMADLEAMNLPGLELDNDSMDEGTREE